MPSLPDSLLPMLQTKFSGEKDYWNAPLEVSQYDIEDAARYVAMVKDARPAVNVNDWLKPRIASFLVHFFIQLSDERLNAMVAYDWLDCLKPFPKDCIDKAIKHWRDNCSNKPKPAEIRNLCINFYGRKNWEYFERAKIISEMHPAQIFNRFQSGWKDDAPLPKPTAEQKDNVRKLLETIGIRSNTETTENV
jgi:hypothetical protein